MSQHNLLFTLVVAAATSARVKAKSRKLRLHEDPPGLCARIELIAIKKWRPRATNYRVNRRRVFTPPSRQHDIGLLRNVSGSLLSAEYTPAGLDAPTLVFTVLLVVPEGFRSMKRTVPHQAEPFHLAQQIPSLFKEFKEGCRKSQHDLLYSGGGGGKLRQGRTGKQRTHVGKQARLTHAFL
jgi:hypothetical protein